MIHAPVIHPIVRRLAAFAALVGLLAGCAGPGASSGPTKLVVGLGYVPNVQFAQFYRAQEAGYYREAGLEVTFDNKTDEDLVPLTAQGKVDISISDGTSVIPAVSQGIPIRYVATIYGTFPTIVYTKASSSIHSPTDLKGKRLGTPGKYGSSWIMLQALLQSVGLTTDDLSVVLYPDYGQSVALERGAVDAATGFTNNEPVQLELHGTPARILHVDEAVPLPGPGFVVGTSKLAAEPEALKAFIAATLKAMREIQADPQKGLDATFAQVPDLAKDPATQMAVLKATIATWSGPYTEAHGLGAIDRSAWSRSIDFLSSLPGSLVPNPVTVDDVVNEELLGD